MKQLKFLSAAPLAVLLFMSSCGSGDGTKTSEATATTDTAAVTKTDTPAKPPNVFLVKFKIANYAKWLSGYEGHDSVRVAYGLHNYVIGRGTKDSNQIMVALRMDDAAKAKEFAAMPDLKAVMKKGGVISAPSFLYLDVQMLDTTTNSSTNRVIITHKVKDYDTWKKSFDGHKPARLNAGLTDRSIAYSVGDNKTVTNVFVINDMKKAEDFMHSKDLKDKMAEAGVTGPPDIFFYTVAKKY